MKVNDDKRYSNDLNNNDEDLVMFSERSNH